MRDNLTTIGFFIVWILIIIILGSNQKPSDNALKTYPLTPRSTVVVKDGDWMPWVKKGYQIYLISEGSSGRSTFVLVKY